ncbi:FAD/FMN-containing isoamyl alcohol oxidase-like protein MreA [Massarina eburnea CBS 473.64]|uniref:FAD/FMN-containing isoamyl alcohol oxidase-like protein MreA n=1 Tax=Massarina eburnea CBS 473.64 TaxID=1395130 RepID=A0A6A6SD71_9PLEO|nr:FAD/FMN-containing isoamyl alcohol oxidase-like protein MreA [Massarina eburnea CBS 473.64]
MAPIDFVSAISAAIVLFARAITADLTVSTPPLFQYETRQLTDAIVASLPIADQKLFGFDDGAVNSTLFRRSGECKVFPGDEDWPSEETWDRFDELIDGVLIPTIPLAASCYKSWGVYDAVKCAAIMDDFRNPYLHEADPTSNMWPIFQGKTCLAFDRPNGTCTLGSYPSYAVNISTVADIQLALNFARNANIRLVIKNTGHDYLGKSLGAGALSIWTHNLKNIDFIENYKSDSGYEGPVMKLAAGVTVREVYLVAEDHDVTVVGGICESVGYAGGYIAGGGHTPMSGYYGMAADNVEALEVVTADGRFITASNSSNPDLYWALRGGGGGTYGVVTSIIVRAHPKMPIVTSLINFASGGNISNEVFYEGVRKYYEMMIPFTDAHTYSYFWIWANDNGTFSFQMTPLFAPNHTIESFNELMKPWFDRLSELGIPFTAETTRYESFYPAYNNNWGNDTVAGLNAIPGNRLFPRGRWEDPVKFEATFGAIKAHSLRGKTIGGYHQAPANRMNVDNAVSSAFRHVINFLIGAALVDGAENATSEQMTEAVDVLTNEVLGPWRAVSPESEFGGSYLNEGNVMEPNWQESFYGIQYPKLLQLKKKWDPKSVFYGPTAVGSEEWEVQDGDQGTQTQNGRLCRV